MRLLGARIKVRTCMMLAIALCAFVGMDTGESAAEITVVNKLSFERNEVVVIPISSLKKIWISKSKNSLLVKESKTSKIIPSQLIDNNSDSIPDELIFAVNVQGNASKAYSVEMTHKEPIASNERRTYARFVPERTDDYAWENDVVAFRTYGPEAQRMIEQNIKGGTLTSGLDCWLKRVYYPIIDLWYKKYVDGGSYHKDLGEGYDPYHVGASRGCGGIGIWKDDSLYVSKNFISYKKIADGPIRTTFELTYAPWKYEDAVINETKRITIDIGSQLYQVKEILNVSKPIPNITVGITLHDKKGVVAADKSKGWFSYWEKVNDSEIGTGVVIDEKYLLDYQDFRTNKKDLSHLLVIAKPIENSIVYYTGFGWTKAGVITSDKKWNEYLLQYSERLNSPLVLTVK